MKNMLAPRPFGNPFESIDKNFFDFPYGLMIGGPLARPADMPSFKCDVKETDEAYEISADFPGASKEDIDISVDGNVVTIAYEHKEEGGSDDDGYIVRERSFSSVKRSFDLGEIDEASATAKLENGTLTVTVPKKEPTETKTTIEIG